MKTAVEALLAKAARSRRAAALLGEQDYLDFAASRAYYALFYVAEALLLAEDLSFSSHAALIAGFGKTFAKTQRLAPRFHRYLIDAQDIRNGATTKSERASAGRRSLSCSPGWMNSWPLPRLSCRMKRDTICNPTASPRCFDRRATSNTTAGSAGAIEP